MSADNVEIRLLDPNDAAMIDAWFAVKSEVREFDLPDDTPPSRFEDEIGLTDHRPGQIREIWLAIVDDSVAGYVSIGFSTIENLDNAWARGAVHPDFRRRGIGRDLWAHANRRAVEEGRTKLATSACESIEGGMPREDHGPRFLEAMGLSAKLTEVHRRVDLSTVDEASLDSLLADSWAHATGYVLRRWVNHAPDELVDGLAYLDGRLLTDAPTGDLDIEAMKVDAERFRADEVALDKRRRTRVNVALVHAETGTVAAWSLLGIYCDLRDFADQGITIVDPDHRGHRLGTVAKIELHRYAKAVVPELRYVHTANAAENTYMISINEQVGYRVVDAWVDYQGEVAKP